MAEALAEPPRWEEVAMALAMAAHTRLGAGSIDPVRSVAASSDLLRAIMRHIALVVPDDAPTLPEALRRAGAGQVVLLRRGEHAVCASLLVERPVHLVGEAGAVIRGMLIQIGRAHV